MSHKQREPRSLLPPQSRVNGILRFPDLLLSLHRRRQHSFLPKREQEKETRNLSRERKETNLIHLITVLNVQKRSLLHLSTAVAIVMRNSKMKKQNRGTCGRNWNNSIALERGHDLPLSKKRTKEKISILNNGNVIDVDPTPHLKLVHMFDLSLISSPQ